MGLSHLHTTPSEKSLHGAERHGSGRSRSVDWTAGHGRGLRSVGWTAEELLWEGRAGREEEERERWRANKQLNMRVARPPLARGLFPPLARSLMPCRPYVVPLRCQ